jgi:hypothetical protein
MKMVQITSRRRISRTFNGSKDANVQRLIKQSLHWQVFHFGKQRKSEAEEKVGREHRKTIFDWVQNNFAEFEKALAKTDFAPHWYPKRADPDEVRAEFRIFERASIRNSSKGFRSGTGVGG